MTEKFYIEEKCGTKNAKELAKELDRAISIVDSHIVQYYKTVGKAGSQFARQPNAVVMTETASSMGDDNKASSKKRQSHITKIKDE